MKSAYQQTEIKAIFPFETNIIDLQTRYLCFGVKNQTRIEILENKFGGQQGWLTYSKQLTLFFKKTKTLITFEIHAD